MRLISRKDKVKHRLSSDERREAILKTAMPLFAAEGFRGVTTKRLAREAGVSEALLYQHFPSKEVLYADVQDYFCSHSSLRGVELWVNSAEPSTQSLVDLFYLFTRMVVEPLPEMAVANRHFAKLMFNSVIEDGTFAHMHVARNLLPLVQKIEASCQAAQQAGDIVPGAQGTPADLRFWLAQHVIVTANLYQAMPIPLYNLPIQKVKTIDYILSFVLRGIGLTEAAFARYYDLDQLAATFDRWLAHSSQAEE